MNEINDEVPYPPGHNWEGLTPSQVNQGYARHSEMAKLQEAIKAEPGKEVKLEIQRTEGESNGKHNN